MRVFGNEIRNNIINVDIKNNKQNNSAKYIKEFKTKKKWQNNYKLKKIKEDAINSAMALLKESKQSEQLSDDA